MFEGGRGTGKGEFDSPTAIAVDPNGNVLVADTNNGRVEKFSPSGTFVTSIGQFEAPNGIAIDRGGNIYVAEIGSKHRVQKLALRVGAAREVAMDSSKALVRSRSIL
jgi:DNA-binding beta-propeller fold protein YncE